MARKSHPKLHDKIHLKTLGHSRGQIMTRRNNSLELLHHMYHSREFFTFGLYCYAAYRCSDLVLQVYDARLHSEGVIIFGTYSSALQSGLVDLHDCIKARIRGATA